MRSIGSRKSVLASLLLSVILVAGALGAGQDALARDTGIEAFYGLWRGSAASKNEMLADLGLKARALNVEVRPEGKGFIVEWTAILFEDLKAAKKGPLIKMQVAKFVPTVRPGIWQAELSEPPLQGNFSYARLDGSSLIVYSMATTETGELELQVYKRTVKGADMDLLFTRLLDGKVVRTIKANLSKFSE